MTDISKLGYSKEVLEKFREFGYDTIEKIAVESPKALAQVLEIPESMAKKIIAKAMEHYEPNLISAKDLEVELGDMERIPTTLKTLDSYMGGGLPTKNLIEFSGPFGSGKTQLCYTINVEAAKKGKVIFIDTENTFRSWRVRQIAREKGYDEKEIINNTFVIRAPTSTDVILTTNKLHKKITELNDDKRVILVVVDSLMAPFRADFIGLAELVERQQKLGWVLKELQRIALKFNLLVIFTNQAVAVTDQFKKVIPAGGHVVAHIAQYRFWLTKSGGYRFIKLIDAPDIEEFFVQFRITKKGVEEVRKRSKEIKEELGD